MNFRPFSRTFSDELACIATSRWAKFHPKTTWALIGLGHVLVAILGINLGVFLRSMGLDFPKWPLFFLVNGFFVTAIYYPMRAEFASSGLFHLRRRRFDVALLALGAAATVFFANRLTSEALQEGSFGEKTQFQTAPANGFVVLASLPIDGASKSNNLISVGKPKPNFLEKILQKRLVKKFHQNLRRDPSQAEKVVWVILLLAAIIGLQYLLAVWACNLSCSGMEGVAVFVTFGGWGALMGIAAWVLRYIFPQKTRKNRAWIAVFMVLFLPLVALLASLFAAI